MRTHSRIQRRFYPNFFVFSLLLIAFLTACGTVRQASCVQEKDKPVLIRWGDIGENSAVSGYEARTTGEIFRYLQASPESSEMVYSPVGAVPDSVYCAMLSLVRSTFVKVQALNVPSKTNRFVEYRDPTSNIALRALWTPEFDNRGNQQFRAVFDSLEKSRGLIKK